MLWAILCNSYARVEARYYDIDFAALPLRKMLNLTYAWLVDLLGGSDEWEKTYAPIFDGSEPEGDSDVVDIGDVQPGRLMMGV